MTDTVNIFPDYSNPIVVGPTNGMKARGIVDMEEEIRVPFGRRCWAEVDLAQIVRNYRLYRDAMPVRKEVMAVVKANAYGHGDAKTAAALERAGCGRFAVSNVGEAARLREGAG